MATIFVHALVPVAVRVVAGKKAISARLLAVACVAAILPDLDVLAFTFGIPYDDPFGHRGFTHSLAFAMGLGLIGAFFFRSLGGKPFTVFAMVALSVASHGVLDSFTNGGLGVAFLWPYTDARFFMPWTPVEVSPIGARAFFTDRGISVLMSELKWLVAPMAAITLASALVRLKLSPRAAKRPPWE